MKNLISLTLLLILAVFAKAQTATSTVTTLPCNHNGVVTTSTTGLTPPLTFKYSFGSGYSFGTSTTVIHSGVMTTSDVLTSYSGALLNVRVNDAVSTVYDNVAAPPFTYTFTSTPAACPALGTASVAVTGGTPPYTYSWYTTLSTGAGSMLAMGTGNPISVPVGGYGVTITDAAGCMLGSVDGRSDTLFSLDTVGVYGTVPFSVGTMTTTASCTNGTATATATPGGTLPYSYTWSTGATTPGISGLMMGYYYVTATDAVGCAASAYAYVPQSVTIGTSTTATPASCVASDGALTVFPSGGMPPYTQLWSTGATSATITGLASGSYGVTVLDANGCVGTGSNYVATSTPITATYTSTASSCTAPTGSATVAASGGTAPYSYIWYTSPIQTTATATALAPGNYNFKITDALGCVRTGTAIVNPMNIINAVISQTPAICTLSNGSLTVSASGGATPYTVLWSTGSTSASVSSLPTGSYSVTVTDAAGCKVKKYPWLASSSPIGVAMSSTLASCIFTPNGTATATAFGGTAPYTYSWTGGAGSSATVSGLLKGPYWVTVSDAAGCVSPSNFVNVGYNTAATSCYCTIQGTIYEDANGNCVQDAGEPGINHVQVYCSGRGYTYTNASGNYSFVVPSGTYTVTETVQTFHPLSACQSNNIVVTAAAASGCVLNVNFANNTTPIHDIHISTWNYIPPRPGFTYNQVTIVTNDGTLTEAAPVAGYKPDGQLFAPSFVPGGVFTGAPYYYSTAAGLPIITPGADQTYYMNYSVPTTTPLGTSVVFKDTATHAAPMSNWTTDYTPWNNVNYYTTTVVGAYDPNFKEVHPKGVGVNGAITSNDSVLEYMVHFQNEGTYYAETVVVMDTIDNNLDWTTLKPVYASAPCKVTLEQAGSAKVAIFTFANIHLPAKQMDDLRSNGMFTYTIKTRPGLSIGSQIRNRASIYFDFNEPIVTNRTVNTIAPVGLPIVPPATGQFKVYPNPTSNTFNTVINSEASGSVELGVSDITGKLLIAKTISLNSGTQIIATDVSQLSPGVYFVTLVNNGKGDTQKLVVIR